MFTIGESRAISHANDTEQQAQVPGNPQRQRFSTYWNSSGERRLKFIASGEDDDIKNPETELFFYHRTQITSPEGRMRMSPRDKVFTGLKSFPELGKSLDQRKVQDPIKIAAHNPESEAAVNWGWIRKRISGVIGNFCLMENRSWNVTWWPKCLCRTFMADR